MIHYIIRNSNRLHELPILSDQRPAIIKFCIDNYLDPYVDGELINETTLFNRKYIAISSNHSRGFHPQLKVIARINLGIEHNIDKLNEQIYKRYNKYQSGESGQNLCEGI